MPKNNVDCGEMVASQGCGPCALNGRVGSNPINQPIALPS